MNKATKHQGRTPNLRVPKPGFIRLRDGRMIYSPGTGERFSREEIHDAVRKAIEKRRALEVG
ncbi:MAG: hypothetical protein AAGJ32_03715 [Pseudomonadota bacterium]